MNLRSTENLRFSDSTLTAHAAERFDSVLGGLGGDLDSALSGYVFRVPFLNNAENIRAMILSKNLKEAEWRWQ